MATTTIHTAPLPKKAQEAMMNVADVVDIIAKRHGAAVDVYPSVIEKENSSPIIALNFKISGIKAEPVAKIIRDFVSSDQNLSGGYIAPKESGAAKSSETYTDKVRGNTLIQMDLMKLSELEPHQLKVAAQKAKTFQSVENTNNRSR